MTIDYTFKTESGYIGSGSVTVAAGSDVNTIRAACFVNAYALGFRFIISVQW